MPLCPWPEGEQGCFLCFLYLVRGQSPCKQHLLCAFGVRCEPRARKAVCSFATEKFTFKAEYLDTDCEVGRLSTSSKGND